MRDKGRGPSIHRRVPFPAVNSPGSLPCLTEHTKHPSPGVPLQPLKLSHEITIVFITDSCTLEMREGCQSSQPIPSPCRCGSVRRHHQTELELARRGSWRERRRRRGRGLSISSDPERRKGSTSLLYVFTSLTLTLFFSTSPANKSALAHRKI